MEKTFRICGLFLPLLCASAHAQNSVPVGELFASDASSPGTAQLAGSGMNVLSGSELSAGIAPATLRLFRGGQVRLCPHSNLTVNTSNQGLMLSSGAGAVEINYELSKNAADVLITPDLNVTLVGPGTFHFALGVNKKGDTCVKPLPDNKSEISFSELLGTGTYKTPLAEGVFFPGSKLEARKALSEDCGCPPAMPILRAAATPTPTPTPSSPPTPVQSGALAAKNEPSSPTPQEQPGQVQVQVDAPFVFSARAGRATPYAVAKIQFSTLPNVFFVQEKVDPLVLPEKPADVSVKTEAAVPAPSPTPAPKQAKKGFFSHVKGFFGALFHR